MFIRYSMTIIVLSTLLSIASVNAADLAIVDFADQWTQVDALRQTLDEFGIEYDDYSEDIEGGNLQFADENQFFFIGSMTTNNAAMHQGLDDNAQVIQDFVNNGGWVLEPTQADQNEANVDWLPDGLVCVRSDPDRADYTFEDPNHPLFTTPNKMGDNEFKGWGHQGWPTIWEVINSQKGFDVIMESQGNPVIMEADFGQGKFIMMSLAPDKYYIAGNDGNTKEMAGLFMENILDYALLSRLPVETQDKLATTWGALKSR